MTIWIWAAIAGAAFSLLGALNVALRYRKGRLDRPELLVFVAGYVTIVSFVIGGLLLRRESDASWVFIVLLPLWLAALYLARHWRLRSSDGGQRSD